MTQDIQQLIDKIKQDGLEAAKAGAKEVEEQARADAKDIVAKAKAEAAQIVEKAKQEAARAEESGRRNLEQASRDMMLSLKKKIEENLQAIVAANVSGALDADLMKKVLTGVIEGAGKSGMQMEEITVTMSPEDQKALSGGFLEELKKKIKQPVVFESSVDMAQGFTISFDKGKSCFDFTDESLAGYLGQFLNTRLTEILNDAVKG